MNIYEFCSEHNIEYRTHGQHHHSTSGWLQLECPQCSPGTGKFRLGWNLKGHYFSCWRCGRVGASAWCDLTGKSFGEVKTLLKEVTQWDGSYEKQRLPGKLVLPKGLGPLKTAHLKYLQNRGFTDFRNLVEEWQIQGIDQLGGELAWHLFIPIYADGEIISWTTRTTGDKVETRYISAKTDQAKYDLKQTLYGIDYCGHTTVVVEGPLSVWKLGAGATALFGTAYTWAQVLALSRFQKRYICLDAEPEAQKVAKKLARDLLPFPGKTYVIQLESAKAPDEASDRELKKLRNFLD